MKIAMGILVLVFGALLAWGDGSGTTQPMATTAKAKTRVLSVAEIRAAIVKIEPLHSKMPKTEKGDWLDSHPEPGQSFDEYLKDNPARLADKFTTIYVQPIGDFSKTQQRLIDDTVEFLSTFFNCPVKKLDAMALAEIPATARRVHPKWGDKQILTGYVEAMMAKRRPKDAIAMIALTTSDLYPGESWNFVFGEASYTDRVGVWSVYRFGDPEKDYTQVLQRTLKVASHETGHMLGIMHCTSHMCGMNGSNNLPEADRQPMAFCPECEAKVWFACKSDPAARFDALAEFAKKHELKDEAEFWGKEAEALRK